MSKHELDVELLEKLCNAFGPTGHEDEIQTIVRNYGQNYCTSVEYDKLGSVIFKKVGIETGPKIMLAGHSDEIGFVITGIEKNGFLTFHQLGGWPDQSLLAQEVLIRPFKGGEKIIGIIAAKPPHVLTPEERNKVVKKENMHIDIGCSSEKEVKELMSDFEIKEITKDHIFPYEIKKYVNYEYRKVWYFRWMPKFLFDWLKKHLGWHLLIVAKLK